MEIEMNPRVYGHLVNQSKKDLIAAEDILAIMEEEDCRLIRINKSRYHVLQTLLARQQSSINKLQQAYIEALGPGSMTDIHDIDDIF